MTAPVRNEGALSAAGEDKRMKLFLSYIRERRIAVIGYIIFTATLTASFILYHLPLAAVAYPAALCLIAGAILTCFDYRRMMRKRREIERLQGLCANMIDSLPPADTIEEKDYQALIEALRNEVAATRTSLNSRYRDAMDYYTVWAHQIKTPIASMRLNLQNHDSELSRQIASDLTRVEQYVEMALTFLRLDSEESDYVIAECEVDEVIKQAVKKFSGEFISRHIGLDYQPTGIRAVSDEKWLAFVIEQVLSNALKYTKEGRIRIYAENTHTVCISDSGVGIAPEDLPRVFDKGYTGYNGRTDKRATGLGLYLCRRVCDNLGHKISASSALGRGTTVRLDFSREKLEIE